MQGKTVLFLSEGFNFKNLEEKIDSPDPIYSKYVPQLSIQLPLECLFLEKKNTNYFRYT